MLLITFPHTKRKLTLHKLITNQHMVSHDIPHIVCYLLQDIQSTFLFITIRSGMGTLHILPVYAFTTCPDGGFFRMSAWPDCSY